MKHAVQVDDNQKAEKIDGIIKHDQNENIRLNKYISSSGYCSRREADRLIESGRVIVNGVKAEVGTKVTKKQVVEVDGQIIGKSENQTYIILNKPEGIICTTDVQIEGNIATFMNFGERIFPVGRLDKNSTGLIILTNDGNIVNKILRSNNNHEKEYVVSVNQEVTEEFLSNMANGIQIYNPVTNSYQITKKCQVEKKDKYTFSIILTEGLNRQIRRMCNALDHSVIFLERIRIMNIILGDLKEGEWRYLAAEELVELNHSISNT